MDDVNRAQHGVIGLSDGDNGEPAARQPSRFRHALGWVGTVLVAVHVVLILSLVLLLAGDAAHGASTRHVLMTLLWALGAVGAAAAAIVAAASRWPLLAGLVLAAAGTWLRAEIEQPPGLLLVATGLAFMGAERASGRVLVRRLVLLAQMVPLALLATVVILVFL